jgi:hypothetical protein
MLTFAKITVPAPILVSRLYIAISLNGHIIGDPDGGFHHDRWTEIDILADAGIRGDTADG